MVAGLTKRIFLCEGVSLTTIDPTHDVFKRSELDTVAGLANRIFSAKIVSPKRQFAPRSSAGRWSDQVTGTLAARSPSKVVWSMLANGIPRMRQASSSSFFAATLVATPVPKECENTKILSPLPWLPLTNSKKSSASWVFLFSLRRASISELNRVD